MVFESTLSAVLNKFLGDFVENLDAKQLSVGIWGGDVELRNLIIKPSALDELDLPIQTVYGSIGKLLLKIPWKSLYTSPWVIEVDNILLLAAPNQQVKYDPVKEEKNKFDAKKKELENIEVAKKAEAEKGKPKPDATFIEKLITTIIKNVQLKVTNIHIRYEDKVTNPDVPFACGLSLHTLLIESTDANWQKAIASDTVKIYKIVGLEALAVYWNCNSKIYGDESTVSMTTFLKQSISSKDNTLANFEYVLGPINASARLRMNQKPESDSPEYSIPKIQLNLDMGKLFIGISKFQYRDIIALTDSLGWMNRGVPYRKYRPNLSEYRGHYKEWWHFAYKCVLEEEVRRRRRNWNWENILGYRNKCRQYSGLYKKQLKKAIKGDEKQEIENCEKILDVTSIVIIRQQIEIELQRLQQIEAKQDKGWFGWIWKGSSSQQDEDSTSAVLLKQFQSEMTPAEKETMYKAIGYQENAAPTTIPKTFIAYSGAFILRNLEIELRDDDQQIKRVLFCNLSGVGIKLEHRPAANAIKADVKIDNFTIEGLQQDNFIPQLITSEIDSKGGLLEIAFETNPLDEICDQKIRLVANPVKIFYDAMTINKVIDIFKVPSDTVADQIQAAAGSGLSNVKQMTSTGLQFTIEKRNRLDLYVDLQAPYVIIPHGGKYTGVENVLVANLGRLKMLSSGQRTNINIVKQMYQQGLGHEDIFLRLKEHCYDSFVLELTDLQILIAQGDEDWRTAVKESEHSAMHLLSPLTLSVTYSKCLIMDDPRFPQNKITGELPSIDVRVSEARFLLLVALGTSIPLPESDVPEPQPLSKSKKSSSMMLLKYKELQQSAKQTKDLLPAQSAESDKEFVQFTTMEAKFVMAEMSVVINQQSAIGSQISELASFKVKNLECSLGQQTFVTNVQLVLSSISLEQNRSGEIISIISTPRTGKGSEYLFKVEFTQIDTNSPELHSKYQSCETSLILDFGVLNITLHQEGLLSLIEFKTLLLDQISHLTDDQQKDRIATIRSKRQQFVISEGAETVQKTVAKPKKKLQAVVVETIKFKLLAELQEVSVKFANDRSNISSCAIKGIVSDIIVKDTYTQVNANLQEISVIDLNPDSLHKLIISGTEGVALKAQIVINNLEGESKKPDMEISAKLGGLRIVFLNCFVSNMLNFLNRFQEAQRQIIEASQAAAKQARENVKNAYDKATKISLDIKLKAPDIVVPVACKSFQALILDLGVLYLSNTFLTLETKNAEGFSAVIDELKVSLSQFQLLRVKLDQKGEKIKSEELIAPINIDIIIRRNLSASWFNAVPDIYISGKIKIIKLLLSQGDYKMIMGILNGNLAEGQVETVEVKQSKPAAVKGFEEHVVHVEVGSVCERHIHIEVKVNVFLKFTFSMDELILNLYTGSDSEVEENISSHSEDTHLAKFSIEGLSIKGRILSDQSIVTSVVIVNCLLDDMRKGRGDKLNRLIERSHTNQEAGDSTFSSTESVAPPKSMIDVTYQQKESDMFVDVRIFSFTIILSVDYLMKLAEFFSTAGTKKPAITTENKQSQTKLEESKQSLPEKQPEKESQMTINLKLEKPDIILVEHMDNIDTNAMILNSEILVKLRFAGPHQVINGIIKDFQLYTCNYNPAHREETRGNVLYPVNISIAGSTPQDKGLHLELLITAIRLSVSPATIELLNRVMVTMTSSGTSMDENAKEQVNHPNLWEQKEFADSDYWFLKTENALEALEYPSAEGGRIKKKNALQELCIITVPSIVFTIEAGVGNKTLPMLILETGFQGAARNWSSQLSLEASLTMQMGYYNSSLALWEPLIEPVEVEEDGKMHFVPWELKVELSMGEQDDTLNATSPTTSESDGDSLPSPVMSIDVVSEHVLEMTVTKTCLEVLQNLSKAFATAIGTTSVKHIRETSAPYQVLNELGEDVTILMEESSFKIAEGGSLEDINKSAAVPLQLKGDAPANALLHLSKELLVQQQEQDKFLHIKIPSKNCVLVLPVGRADKRFFSLNYRGDGHDNWGIISDIKVDKGSTIVTLRSVLQVYNHFCVPIDVYYMTAKGNELELIGAAQPGGYLNIPLKAVYTPTNELFFAISGHSITSTPYIWKDLQTSVSFVKLLQCSNRDFNKGKGPFIIKCIGKMEQVYFEDTVRHTMTSTCYNIHLRPSVIFKNFLPIDVVCCVDEQADEFEVKAGDTLQLPNIDPGRNVLVIRLPEYLEKEWSCRYEISEEPEEFAVWTFDSYDSPTKMSLDLGMHTLNKNGSFIMSLYCPFWMLNKTGLMIGYRDSDENLNVLHHPPHFMGPILFSFNAKHFFGKKKATIRVELGDWSDKFSLDVAGSSGVISCKANDRLYQIGVHIQLTYNNLTKQVTFTPYYVIINNAPYAIECQENDRPADHWLAVEPKSCSPLWPRSDMEDKLLRLRVEGTTENSAPFLYTESHNTLLRLNNKYGGVNVDIQITEGAIYINLVPYEHGSAPALLINHTDSPITFWEKESVQKRILGSKHSLLYTWENPSGPRLIVWDKGNNKELVEDLRKDACGEYSPTRDKKIYWASFLDGMQRVLLFTEVKMIAESAEASNLLEIIQQEINVSIHGIGLSLINNLTRQEIMYLGIASSGIIWESCKMNGRRYKSLNQKLSMLLENAYQQYLLKQIAEPDEDNNIVTLDGKIVVDFKSNLMLKPSKKKMRRTFETGLWLQMKSSPNQMHIHAKINRLQIDNQIFDCIFPIVLAPVPPPKSVAVDSGIKPFVEVSIVQLLMKNSQIKQFKYFKVLVQEFHIKVDLGFINAIVELLQESEQSDEEEKKHFLTDMHLVDEGLYSHVSGESIREQKSFYDLLHFSPLKIHISFSMAAGSSPTGQNVSTPNFLKIILQGIGVTLTDLQDVVFKLAFFERTFTFLTQKQLTSEVTSHYIGQSVKQLYVLVLGLDVIGNPYGLVLGITKGVEDLFYEPFQGAIQGPGEFAEGLALGVRSLFGHTVGGAAGAVSRITGAMGKGIAVLTFDEEYQRKRRDQLNKKPATVTEGFARSGKGLVMGVVSGVTGVVTKPVSGAREQGVEGFFKGLGKGAVGLVARPVAGVVDFASGSLDAVKRCAESGEEICKLRPARFIPADGLVRPFNSKEAMGHKLLMELSKGKYARTDIYAAHYVMIEEKEVLLLTDKRIAYICHNDIFGGWQIEWAYTWDELPQAPKVVPKGVLITTSEKKKRLFGSSDATKTLLIGDPAEKEEICLKIESLRGN
ncbi:vacuolar protein sorting-associated protein 13 isoform X2 [Anoplophora glabripennis]|uniref:vacuolar protein sorting-associated protein 13 isoform X2 n=1 Tax=Anoplophora glabripennis TaxID=217634 RepID=UPI0008753F80|nr:vacuolar protein sorting-associated protein 13 isoform X2 [Anoplophora glabripennis]